MFEPDGFIQFALEVGYRRFLEDGEPKVQVVAMLNTSVVANEVCDGSNIDSIKFYSRVDENGFTRVFEERIVPKIGEAVRQTLRQIKPKGLGRRFDRQLTKYIKEVAREAHSQRKVLTESEFARRVGIKKDDPNFGLHNLHAALEERDASVLRLTLLYIWRFSS